MAKRMLTCCCCGRLAGRFEQHWNRDDGFGICRPCVKWCRDRGMDDAAILSSYGQEGVNYAGPDDVVE